MGTANLDVQGYIFAFVKSIQCNFDTGIAIFYTARIVCFAVQKLQCLGYVRAHLGARLCFTLELPNDAVQNSGTSSEDTTPEESKTARTKAQQHCSRDTPTHVPHPT